MANSNHDRITYRVLNFFVYRDWKSLFSPTMYYDCRHHQRRNAQQYRRNLCIAVKYIYI